MKQDPFANVYRALTPKELAEKLIPKTEAERLRDAAKAEIERLTRERDEARYFLRIFVHAHAHNNAVPPHIDGQAREALEAKP